MKRKVFLLILTAISVGSISIHPAMGEGYPTEPIEIVCPFTPGGTVDTLTRLVADIVPKYLKQPVVVLNKPGGALTIGASYVIKSKPDGYKLIMLDNFFLGYLKVMIKMPFDPNDLVPIANMMETKLGLNVRGDAPWNTLHELLEDAKKNPGKISWAHTGRGKSTHLNGLLLSRKAGVDMVEVPYKGTPEMISALLGGHIDVSAMAYGPVKAMVKAGKVRYLMFFSDQRYADPSDVPSATEVGFPEVGMVPTRFGLYAHKETPENIKRILEGIAEKVYKDPEFQKGIERFGEEPRFMDSKSLMENIKEAEKIYIPIIKELGLAKK